MMYSFRFKFLFLVGVFFLNFKLFGQNSWLINEDSLTNSLKVLLEEKKLQPAYKHAHFIIDNRYDYYSSINSVVFSQEVQDILRKIALPIKIKNLSHITFIKCYNWTESYSIWYITLVDNFGKHYIYHYKDNMGTSKIELRGVIKGEDFFYKLAKNLISRCSEKNEDYLTIARMNKSKFTSFFSSQNFHTLDLIFFYDLLQLVKMIN